MIPPRAPITPPWRADLEADICALARRPESEGKFGFDAGDAEVGVLHLSTVRQDHVVKEIPIVRLERS